jgi:hypothetical protein
MGGIPCLADLYASPHEVTYFDENFALQRPPQNGSEDRYLPNQATPLTLLKQHEATCEVWYSAEQKIENHHPTRKPNFSSQCLGMVDCLWKQGIRPT